MQVTHLVRVNAEEIQRLVENWEFSLLLLQPAFGQTGLDSGSILL